MLYVTFLKLTTMFDRSNLDSSLNRLQKILESQLSSLTYLQSIKKQANIN